ncbi:MAG TPA: O-antigen ligase family protein [Candidatus Acidoferrales bacterium]|nr:O-antigen ligase family protein [Candidatus Acidoferrales bacterium]
MSSAAWPQRRSQVLAALSAAVIFGCWAAAIATARSVGAKALLAAPAVLLPLVWWTLLKPGRWLAGFFAAALLLPPLPVPAGNSGPHVCLLWAAMGLFSGLLRLPDWRIVPCGLSRALLALGGAMLASVAFAAAYSGAAAAAGSLVRVLLFAVPVYVFFHTAYGPARAWDLSPDAFRATRRLFWIAAASALFACVDFYFQFPAPAGYGPQFIWLDSGVFRRAQGLFYEASTLGNFCAFFLVMIAVALARPRTESPVSRKALVAGGAVLFAALVLSFSRGSLVNVAVALAVLVWVNRRRLRFARLVPVLAACIGAAALLTWKLFPAFAEMYWLRLSGSAQFFFSETEGILSGRVASWRTLLDWIAANPWQTLFGVGYKTLPYTTYLGSAVVADNMYLSLLVETGVAGLAALLWLNVCILRDAGRAARAADPRRSFFGTWMLCFWAGQSVQMLSGDLLTYWRVLPVYFWVLALAVRV